MTLRMKPFELFSGLIQLNLSGLSFGNLQLKLLGLLRNFDSKLLNLQSKLFDLRFICSPILFECEVVFLLLPCRQSPLFELFLVPVHFKLELVHLLVRLEDHVLDVVEAVLLVCDALLELFYLVPQTA